MSKYELVAALAFMMTSGGVAITLITSWFRYRERLLHTKPGTNAVQEQRLARIESAVEAIAIEVERISEGQRFTTRLLTERHGAPAGLAPIAAGEPASPLAHRQERNHAS